jgi:hypothetical protein
VWLFGVNPFARSEICEFDCIAGDEYIFGFDISMEDAFAMYVFDGFE